MKLNLKLLAIFALAFLPLIASAQATGPLNINVGNDLLSSQRLFQLIAITTVLTLAPSILMMVTSFTRIVIVFAFLRTAMGLQTTPPNTVLISLALFLTLFIMAPVMKTSYEQGISPYLNGQIEEAEAFERGAAPFRTFMLNNVRESDLDLFLQMLPEDQQVDPELDLTQPEAQAEVPLVAIVPAFMISELRRAFEIGFLLFLPFLVIDLAVASILMSMGMMMLPPIIISLPFKIIFFVLVDGWHLLVGSLVESFKGVT